MKTYVLDACAIIALLNDEDGAEVVDNLIVDAAHGRCSLVMNKFNLLEVYYGYFRDFGLPYAEQQLSHVRSMNLMIIDHLTDAIFRQTAKLKATYRISLADAVAIAQAMLDNATVVTCDHHELDAVDRDGRVSFLWIR